MNTNNIVMWVTLLNNADWGLFQDSDFAGELEDSKSTSGKTLCVFGSHTFVPVSWMWKNQTSVSHSSTESEIISLDAGLRLDGLLALDLGDLIVSVLGNTIQTPERPVRPVVNHKDQKISRNGCPNKENLFFQSQTDRIKTPGGDQELRTSTLVRPRPIQGEGHVDFLGESEGSLLQPHDSFPVAGEDMHDFWSMSGSFIYRHHVEPRVALYSPREESFRIPLKYIDVTRTTHTNLDVKQEKRIDDYWNIDGSRDLSDPWTGFTQCTLLRKTS